MVYAATDVAASNAVFQQRSLMDYGILLGNGGYFGLDFAVESARGVGVSAGRNGPMESGSRW